MLSWFHVTCDQLVNNWPKCCLLSVLSLVRTQCPVNCGIDHDRSESQWVTPHRSRTSPWWFYSRTSEKKIKIPERVIITLRMFKFAHILLHSNPADYQKTKASSRSLNCDHRRQHFKSLFRSVLRTLHYSSSTLQVLFKRFFFPLQPIAQCSNAKPKQTQIAFVTQVKVKHTLQSIN